ncbi:MAG: hypothetical protein DYH12_32960 [Sorangiineae bacterium PRO1]|nr:hypothetical protein [Sorangiineae bacterium PRO1]
MLLATGLSSAQDHDAARADALFHEGRSLMKRGDYRAACPMLAESQRLDPGAGTLINLGDCTERLGKLADALQAYRDAERLLPKGDPRGVPVQRQIVALKRRVPTLTIRLGFATPDGTRVTHDGVELSATSLGVAHPVNAGEHVVVVSVPGRKAMRRKVSLRDGQHKDLLIDSDEDSSGRAPVDQGSSVDGVGEKPSAPGSPPPSSTPVPWIVGGAGVASLAASGVFFLMRQSATSELERDCLDRVCPGSSQGTIDRANRYGTAGLVTLAVGVAGVSVAVVMLGSRSGSEPAASRPRIELGAGATRRGASAVARARF